MFHVMIYIYFQLRGFYVKRSAAQRSGGEALGRVGKGGRQDGAPVIREPNIMLMFTLNMDVGLWARGLETNNQIMSD